MNYEGWTWGDLVSELMVRGIDPDQLSDRELGAALDFHDAEQAADAVEEERARGKRALAGGQR